MLGLGKHSVRTELERICSRSPKDRGQRWTPSGEVRFAGEQVEQSQGRQGLAARCPR